MDALIFSLLAWLNANTSYDTQVTLPNITITEQANLCFNYADRAPAQCQNMRLMGFYNERHTIFLYAGFEDDNPADQARLLHELVHYIQWHNGENVGGCWGMLEAEAYRLQDQWRLENNMPEQADPSRLVMLVAACDS